MKNISQNQNLSKFSTPCTKIIFILTLRVFAYMADMIKGFTLEKQEQFPSALMSIY